MICSPDNTLQGFSVTVIAAGAPSVDAVCQHTLNCASAECCENVCGERCLFQFGKKVERLLFDRPGGVRRPGGAVRDLRLMFFTFYTDAEGCVLRP